MKTRNARLSENRQMATASGGQTAVLMPDDCLQQKTEAEAEAPAWHHSPAADTHGGETWPGSSSDPSVFSLPVKDRIPVQTAPCPVCGSTTAFPHYSLAGLPFRLISCHECGLGRLHPPPTAKELSSFYSPSYYGSPGRKFVPLIETAVRWAACRRARLLLRGLPRPARVLDVGCGRGVFLKTLADAGCETHGFEISREAAAGLDSRATLHVGDHLAEARLPADSFDLIILWHVLEHLPNPRETLEEIHRLLKPNGRLAVAVPNFSSWQARLFGPAWFHLDLPRHLFHFPAATLQQLLNQCGYDVEQTRYFSLRHNPFGWIQSLQNVWWPQSRNALYRLLKSGNHPSSAPEEDRHPPAWLTVLAGGCSLPLAGLLALLAALFRNGATVFFSTRKVTEKTPPQNSGG